MNKQLYKIIFSKRLGTLVAVGEHTSSTGKAASGQGCRGSVVADGFVGALRFTFASVALACLSLGNTQAQSSQIALPTNALPQGGSVSTGSATISTQGAAMAITQTTDKASINWQSFNVGTGASVNIAQPSSDAVLLNRVVGNDPSQILGQLKANGQFILLNPNGVLFGKDGSVTASSFTASTFGLSDADFMAGYYKYNRNGSTADVVNQGTIETSAGGFVALIGATVTNEGRIIAPHGDVVMAAAESLTLPEELVKPKPVATPSPVSVRMSKRVRLELDPAAINTAVNNTESGVIVTEGGQVLLQAAAISSAVASVTHSGSIDTSAPQAGAVTVLTDNGVIKVDGSIKANSSGTDNQSQARKGADIIIGRDIDTGVLAHNTNVSGANLESQGGFVETSGDWLATNGVRVKARDWLLDPTDIKIVASNTATEDTRSVTSAGTTTLQDNTGILASEVLKSTIESAINSGTNVTISTANPTLGANGAGNITIETALSFNNTGSQAATLRLSAVNGITQNAGATITATGSQMVHIDMAAEGRYMGNPAANAGSLGITLNSAITTNGDVTLNGKATHTDAGNATYGIGVNGWTNANISARNISITGNSANSFGINYRGSLTASGNITQDGTSQNWVGVVSSGAVNATGALSITGETISGGYQGINIDSNIQGATVTLSGESNANAGVSLANARSITSTIGDIAITGTSAGGNGITVGSDGSTTASANIRSARNMSLVGQGSNTGIKVWFSSVLAAGNSSTAGTINLSGTSVTGAGQTGYGIDFSRYPNAATLTATADINIVGTLSGLGDGSAIKTSWSGQNGNGPSMTAGGKFTLRGNNRAAATNTSATINAESGMQINAAGDIVLQAETNNDNVGAIVFYSTSDMYRGNTSLVSTVGDVLIQANQGGIRFNNQQSSTAGKLTTISGRNISIDNTGAGMATGSGSLVGSGGTTGATIGSGSINATTGAITSGAGKAQAEGLNFADARSITASSQLHLTGISRTAEGIKSVANLTGASITANGSSDTSMGINATGGSFTATSGAVNLAGRNLVSGGRGMTLSGTVSALGDVNLSGYSVSTGDRHGMVITNAVSSSGGNINLTGQTTASTVPAITITGASAAVSVSNGRSININANSLNLESSATLNAGTGTVNIKTLTTGNEIVVGGSDVLGNTLTSQKLGIANSELNLITAGRVVIGDINSTGAVKVTGATTTLASAGNIDLRTGGSISVEAAFNVNKNLTLQTNGGNIATTAAVTGTHISIDNTNGTIDSSTGGISVGVRSAAGTDGISLGGDVTASGNLNLYGVSSNQYGIQLAANKTIRGGVIQGTGRTSSGYSAVLFNGGSNVITTGTSGDSLITAYSTGGSGAFYTSANVTAASGTTLTLDGQATNTGGRGMRLEGWTTATGRVSLKGSSDNSTDGLISINGQVTAATNSQLSIVGTTNKAGTSGVVFVNGGGVALSSGATLDVNGQNTSTSGTGYGVSIQGNGITKLTGAGAVSITGSTSSTTLGALGVYVAAGVATDGNIDIQGNGASSANSGVHIGAAVTSAGTGTAINIGSNYAITHDGSISVSGATGTGGNINLTSTNRGIWGAGTIGTTTNKNANVTFTQSTSSTFNGAINAANLTKAGSGSLTLDSWIAATPATTNISNAYNVNSGELSLSLSGTYPSINPASVNVVNNATFSLSNAGNGFWRNTAFNFTGGLGGGTMNLLGNPVGASNTTNTFSTSGGATNTVNGLLNANSANVDLNLAQAASGTTLLDGSFAALVFAQNSQGGFGIDSATTINANGPGGLLFKDKLKATQFNINSGTVQFGDGTAAAAATTPELQATNVAIAGGAKLIFNRAEASTNNSAFTGSGTLLQAGAGALTLTGNSGTFAGSTTVNDGRALAVGTNGSLGAAGSTLNLASATSSVAFTNASGTAAIGSTISGAGTLSKSGDGTGLLTANNSYTGTTTISAGTLQIGNDTTTGTLGTEAVTNNAMLDFKRSANTNVTNTITGSGDMQATLSAGGLRLLGNVTLGGDVNLSAEHATDWIGVQFLSNVSAGGDINISGGSSTRHGVQVDAFKTLKTTSLGAQSVTITGSTSSVSAAGIAVIGEIQTNNGSTLLATGTATNGGNGIYSELTTGGTNYGKIGSATSGDITLVGTSSGGTAPTSINSDAALNRGHGMVLRGGITTQGHISLTGEADNGVGVFLQHSTYDYGRTMAEAQPTLQVLSGGANMAGQDAIFISGTNFGSNAFNNNGVLIGSKLINNSNRGATTITSTEGGIALVTSTTGTSTGSGSITNAATAGAISLTAGDGTATSSASIGSLPASIGTGNNVSRAWTLSPAGTQITQNSNAGVTITSDGTGNVTPSKITNNGTGDIVIGAGTQLNAGDGTGGQVLTVSGNTISQNNFGKTYVYTGAAASTGALSNLSSSFNTLYFTGTAPAAFNSAFNTAFGNTIASGQNTQVLFRDSAGPSFVANLPNITKTYGDADPANLNTALQTAYTNSGGGAYLTQAVNGAAGSSNTFAIKASELIADVNITRTAGEAVGNYALNMVGTTMNANITGSTALSIGKRDITLAGITASNKTYDGSNAATVTAGTFNNLKAGETLLISGTGSFADANVGNGKAVTANVANLNKTDGLGSWSNYNLTSAGNANGSANITPAALTITVNGSSAFVTQDPNSAFNQGFSYSGFVNGETAASALTAAPTRSYIGAANPTVGTYANVYDVANTVIAKNGNYTITVNKGALNVIAADALLLNVASQSSVYGSITAANADTPAANTVTAQYCLAPLDCNGSNIVNLSLRKGTAVPNQWVVNDSTSSTVQFTTALQNTSYSSGGYLQVGNYDYSLSSSSPVVIGTQNFNTVVSNTGTLAVTPLAVTLQNTPISKAYDGTTSLPNTTLSISNLPTGDDLQASFTAGAFQSSAVSTAAPFSLYGVALAGIDSANYTLQNYANNTYSSTGVITGTTSKPLPIVHPPKPIIPTDNTSGGGESGGDSSSGNPYLLFPSGRPNSADRCTPNTLEDCLCETQEPRPVEGITICYQPKKTASTTPAKGRRG